MWPWRFTKKAMVVVVLYLHLKYCATKVPGIVDMMIDTFALPIYYDDCL